MKTRYYQILNKNDEVIYVGLTTTAISQRFCRHIISKNLNRIDYKCVQIDEIDNGKIETLEDYYREKKRAGDLERYYINQALNNGAKLLNISKGGEWNSHILDKLIKEDFFEKYGSYDGYIEYKKEYNRKYRMTHKYRTFVYNWYFNKSRSPYWRKLHNWIGYKIRPKYKRLIQNWFYHHSENKYKRFIKRWVRHYTENKYKKFIRHWYGHRTENPYKNLLAYRVRRKTRNRYHHILLRLTIRRRYNEKQKMLEEQGLLTKRKNKYKNKIYEWVRYKSMNPYERILKRLVKYKLHKRKVESSQSSIIQNS